MNLIKLIGYNFSKKWIEEFLSRRGYIRLIHGMAMTIIQKQVKFINHYKKTNKETLNTISQREILFLKSNSLQNIWINNVYSVLNNSSLEIKYKEIIIKHFQFGCPLLLYLQNQFKESAINNDLVLLLTRERHKHSH